ncbi:MAG: hypothetical protein HFE81_00880 [Bacilli bacterium]|nr:hypothetical protein [Bacilli bacterium]
MKNKIILLGILVIGIFSGVIAVNAEEPTTEEKKTWPATLTYEDYEFSIDGIDLRIYKLNSDNEKTTTETDENGLTTTITTSEDAIKYIKDEPTKVINLTPADYTISPEYKEDKINGYSTIFIDLNLNITKEKLETLLSEELNQVSDKITYITELVVNYKLTKVNDRYKYFKNVNTIKEMMNLFMPDIGRGKGVTGINMANSQVFNIAFLGLDGEKNKSLGFESTLSEESDNSVYLLNYLALSSREMNNESAEEIEQLVMFHNVDNIEYLIENFKKIEDNAKDEIKNSTENPVDDAQVVKVDNTAMEVPKYVYIMSIISMVLGAISIILVVNGKRII